MDRDLFITLLRNLLNVNVLCSEDGEDIFSAFEKKYCYHSDFQPMFTERFLRELAGNGQEHIFYEIRDEFGIWMQLFRYENDVYLLGPYVKRIFDEELQQRRLLSLGLPAAYVHSLRLYYSAFPVLSSTLIRNTVVACLTSLTGLVQEFSSQRLERDRTPLASGSQELFSDVLDYSSVYLTYDLENDFLHTIETGDTENVLLAIQNLEPVGLHKNRYTGSTYQDPMISLSIVRALARKAAERGGASVVEIHEITQRSVQKMMAARSQSEQSQATEAMLLELTEAVRRHQLAFGEFSTPIRRALEYLHLNYSQDFGLEFLADRAGFSVSYFSRAFKKEVGVSVFAYLTRLRCNHAADMLCNTDLPIHEIGSYVGYPDSNYFVKVFKKEHGMTPSEYRKEQKARQR